MTLLPLAPGSRVGVFAPSGVFDEAGLEAGLAMLRGWGLEPVVAPGLHRRHRYMAGDDRSRLEDLRWALCSPALDAAWMARGGYGLIRLLHRLRWADVGPRPVLGFSDGTALFQGMWLAGCPLPVHAPVLHSLTTTPDQESREAVRALLLDEPRTVTWSGDAVLPGQAEGPLVGGNLCTIASLAGTPAALDARGAILFMEEVNEPPYKIDRMLHQLLLAGCLEGARGVVLGTMLGCEPPEKAGWTLGEVLQEILAPLGVPVLSGLPVGHGSRNHPFPWGAFASMEVGRGEGRLSWLSETAPPVAPLVRRAVTRR